MRRFSNRHNTFLPLRGASRKAKLIALTIFCVVSTFQTSKAEEALAKIKTIVVIYAENRSFDHLYGFFAGANGIANATTEQKTQLDHDGTPLPYLTIFGPDGKPDAHFPKMPNMPFRIDAPPINMALDKIGPDPIHAFFHNQEQINNGRNNMADPNRSDHRRVLDQANKHDKELHSPAEFRLGINIPRPSAERCQIGFHPDVR